MRGKSYVSALAVAVATLAFPGGLSAAPPEVFPPKLTAKVGKPAFFDVKTEAGKKFGAAYGFDREKCTVVRLWSEDPSVASFMVIANTDGEFYVSFVTQGEVTFSQLVITTGAAPVVPPVKPKDPPVTPPSAYYFLIVRADGPADPAFTKLMALPEWGQLRLAGHSFKDKTATEARALGIPYAPPAVAILQVSADGLTSKIVGTAPLPRTAAEVLALPSFVK